MLSRVGPRVARPPVFAAARRVGIGKVGTCHTFRHSFAPHLLEAGYHVRQVHTALPACLLNLTWMAHLDGAPPYVKFVQHVLRYFRAPLIAISSRNWAMMTGIILCPSYPSR